MSLLLKYNAALLSTIPYTLAQTCPSDTGSTQSTLHYNFVESSSTLAEWTTLSGNPTISSEGVELTINKQGDAPTIETPNYIFFGEISIVMKASAGTGMISSIVLESDDLDETPESLTWSIDGTATRTLSYSDAANGTLYPQTSMQGTIDWADGETDYSQAPFTMVVRSVDIVHYYPAESYAIVMQGGKVSSLPASADASGSGGQERRGRLALS
ncbi:concanavalin A-like lectin/glucanase [Aspergillus eucalypticola CBS 122712]|uniref:Concanavalin A-like lectin/glucanase n=1 Tax=Aspergillus eucalypticola (strain CBS 122712 / IBT 29274) TaxID=1448314 RepID=A0A317USS9_ASPEC|nr:concanavalin A-like lectin/glucanase [Aspergillus eucalypticola CBS 122712]PWY63140.1 concanavalin A-like lectin/glucanase [Aspergillus eucalypticola CBS 122712]